MDPATTTLFPFVPLLLLALAGISVFIFASHTWLALDGADPPIHAGIAGVAIGSALELIARYVQLTTNDPAVADFVHRIFVALLLALEVSVVGVTRAFARVDAPWRGMLGLVAITAAICLATISTSWFLAPPSIRFVHLFGWSYWSPSSPPAQLLFLPLNWGTLVYSGLLLRSAGTVPREERRVLSGLLIATLVLVANNCLLGIGVLPTVSLMEFIPPLSAMALSGTLLVEHRRLQTQFDEQVAEQLGALTGRQRELEAALSAARGATGARSRVLAHMSHVLESSLEGIAAAAAMLADEALSERSRPQLTALKRATERLSKLVANVTEAARLGDDHVIDEQSAFSPLVEFEAALDAHAPAAKQKGLELGLELADAVPRLLIGDVTRLRRLLGHLLDNAVRFTSSGRVQLRARVAESTTSGVRLRVEVADTGPGLSPGARARIFEPFVQPSGGAPTTHGGFGLGLALSRAILERLGGSIGVESDPEGGSVFWFEISFARPKPAAHGMLTAAEELSLPTDSIAGRRAIGGGLLRRHVDERPRVLVVDADATNQRLMKALLLRLGFGADVVASDVDALEAIGGEQYGLLLIDCATRTAGGLGLILHLRSSEPAAGRRFPIIALVAHPAAAEPALAAGADDFLTVPIDPAQLAAMLARRLED